VRNRFREKFAERDVYDEEAAPARLAGAGFSPPRVRDPPAARLLSETKGEGKVSSISTAVRETKGVPLESTRSMGIPCFGYWTHIDSDNGCSSFIRLTN